MEPVLKAIPPKKKNKSYPRGWSGEIPQKAIEAVLWTFRGRKTKKMGAEGVRKEVAS